MLLGFHIKSGPSAISQKTFCAFELLKISLNILTRVGSPDNIFNVFDTGRLLLKVQRKL